MPVPAGFKQINPTISVKDDERISELATIYAVDKLWLVTRLIRYGMRHVKAAMAEWKTESEATFTDEDDKAQG